MNTRYLTLLSALTLASGAAHSAPAGSEGSPWSFSVFAGDAVSVGGSLRNPALETIPDLGTLDPALAGSAGTLALDHTRNDDLFDHPLGFGTELGYSFTKNLEGYGRLTYESYSGRDATIGTLTSEALAAPAPLEAHFSDANSLSFDLGARYYWAPNSTWRPFAGASLGAMRMDALKASLDVPGTAISEQDASFTRSATVFTQSAEAGLEFAPSRNFGVRFAVDADHVDRLPSSNGDAALTALGIDTTQSAENHWSFPIMLSASYRFGTPG